MKKSSVFAALAMLAASLTAQTFPTSAALPAAVPDGTGACTAGAPLVLTVPVSGVSGAIGVTLDFSFGPNHTWHGDLQCIVTEPGGATSTVMIPGCTAAPDDSSDVGGPYVLSDLAAQSFDAAAVAFTGVGGIPAGTYGPDNALNPLLLGGVNGNWTVTFMDHFIGDMGSVAALALSFSSVPPATFSVTQAAPGAPTVFFHQAGMDAITWTNVVTILNPAAVPNGWWFGLDVAMFGPLGVIDQLTNFPGLFFGPLAPGGTNSLPLAIPAPFNFQTVGVHFNAAGIPIFASLPIDFTVL